MIPAQLAAVERAGTDERQTVRPQVQSLESDETVERGCWNRAERVVAKIKVGH